MPNRRIFQSLFYGLAMVILILSLLPIEHPSVSPNDKVNHLVAYGTLMMLGYAAHRRFLIVILGVISWGVVIEIMQGQTSYRMLSYADVLANSAGALLGCAGIVLTQKISKSRSH